MLAFNYSDVNLEGSADAVPERLRAITAPVLSASRPASHWPPLSRSRLFQVAPADPVTFVVVPIVFAFVALAACLIAAYGAIRLDPAKSLLIND
jgi:hypothetical protein